MIEQNNSSSLLDEINALQNKLSQLERNYVRIDRILSQQSKLLLDVIDRIANTATTNWPQNRSNTTTGVSRSQGLAELTQAVLNAMKRHI